MFVFCLTVLRLEDNENVNESLKLQNEELEKENHKLKDELLGVNETIPVPSGVAPMNESVPLPTEAEDDSKLVPATIFEVRSHSPSGSVYVDGGRNVMVKQNQNEPVANRSFPAHSPRVKKPPDALRPFNLSKRSSHRRPLHRSEESLRERSFAESFDSLVQYGEPSAVDRRPVLPRAKSQENRLSSPPGPRLNDRAVLPRARSQDNRLSAPPEEVNGFSSRQDTFMFDLNANVVEPKPKDKKAERKERKKKISRPHSFAGVFGKNRSRSGSGPESGSRHSQSEKTLERRHTVSNRSTAAGKKAGRPPTQESGNYRETTYF